MQVFLTTFNLAETADKLSDKDIEDWLQPAFRSESQAPELVAVGVQEMVPLALSLAGLSTPSLISLSSRLCAALTSLSTQGSYIPLTFINHCGVALFVFYKEDALSGKLGKAVTSTVGLAQLGMGNKAAVGVRVGVDRGQGSWESFTFVAAHLAAHDHHLQTRNANWKFIVQSLLFPSSSSLTLPHQIHHATHLFLMGDLNYRLSKLPTQGRLLAQTQLNLSASLTSEEQEVLKERKELVCLDTLKQEQGLGKTLLGMKEGKLEGFAPTYKRIPGQVDGYSSKRIPGYTDRILYASLYDDTPGEIIISGVEEEVDEKKATKVLEYGSLPEITISDHKPVYSLISLPLNANAGTSIHNTPFLTLHTSFPIPTAQDQLAISSRKFLGFVLDRLVGCNWILLKPTQLLTGQFAIQPLLVVVALEFVAVLFVVGALFGWRPL